MCDWHFVFFVCKSYGLRLLFASKKIANLAPFKVPQPNALAYQLGRGGDWSEALA
jgi:hypothetical protein